MMNQKDAVYNTVVNFKGNDFQPKGIATLTADEHAKVTMLLAEGFVSGAIKHRTPAKVATIETAAQYSKGLLTNWLKRDSRFAAPVVATPAAE